MRPWIRRLLDEALRHPDFLPRELPESATFADAFVELLEKVGDDAYVARFEEHLPEMREMVEAEKERIVLARIEGALERLRARLAPAASLEAGKEAEERTLAEEEEEEEEVELEKEEVEEALATPQ
eukprot:TRINITY_DN1038_c1_g1_i1.p3 TRINITY_DN1038_c1_g1~~TRINITY_DN1038_c1_g1_i1.p3  ORF type:complete len:126 (-),score=44.87 TRINITY_DN1038_c1_g1_i1:203-580(-)